MRLSERNLELLLSFWCRKCSVSKEIPKDLINLISSFQICYESPFDKEYKQKDLQLSQNDYYTCKPSKYGLCYRGHRLKNPLIPNTISMLSLFK